MKRIIVLFAALLLCQTMLFAQNGKSVNEKDVPERYIKDFRQKEPDAKKVQWYLVDSMVYDATFTNESGTLTSYRFSLKGTETRWYIEPKYYPHAITENINATYPGYHIKSLCALLIKNKVTYQVLVGKRKGLFVKKWKHMRYLNYEADGKFIDEIEL